MKHDKRSNKEIDFGIATILREVLKIFAFRAVNCTEKEATP